jgi:hypothetical protein
MASPFGGQGPPGREPGPIDHRQVCAPPSSEATKHPRTWRGSASSDLTRLSILGLDAAQPTGVSPCTECDPSESFTTYLVLLVDPTSTVLQGGTPTSRLGRRVLADPPGGLWLRGCPASTQQTSASAELLGPQRRSRSPQARSMHGGAALRSDVTHVAREAAGLRVHDPGESREGWRYKGTTAFLLSDKSNLTEYN